MFDSRSAREIDRALLSRMNEAQHHRGPDEGGLHVEAGVGLGHRRLSIIDLSSGHQPLFNEDGSVAVVFNGEIYNFQELQDELEREGHAFRTRCDTEVIVHAWESWGESCVARFRGMFAFAIWDRRKATLFLARDRLGKKPLYYSLLADGTLIFASELKALRIHPDLPRRIHGASVEDYFAYGYVPEPRTIFQGVHKLPPAHTLAMARGGLAPTPRPYWNVSFRRNGPAAEEDVRREIVERFREAVKVRLIAEVPLGAFLSGGVDSSAVVAMMAGLSAEPVNTCSISFGDPAFNETQYAGDIARRYRTRHHVEQVDSDDFDLIDTLARVYDEPFADSSAIPTYRVCELARKRVTVALSGDGGDESLAGYLRYRQFMLEERLRSLLPLSVRRPAFGLLAALYPKADRAPRIFRAKATLEALARDTVQGYLECNCLMHDELRRTLFSPEFRRGLQGYAAVDLLRAHAREAPTDDPLSLVQYLDMKTYLPGDILVKVDRASMAHSLEVRAPLLDHLLVDWISGIPPRMKLRGGEGKYVFKKAMESYLPADILYRPKMGFAVPLAGWFRGPLKQRVQDAVLGPTLGDTGIFDRNSLRAVLDQHQSGRRDHSSPIWGLLMFEAFLRTGT
jgi:asparagine synthase (glutamine-hydrolysing)